MKKGAGRLISLLQSCGRTVGFGVKPWYMCRAQRDSSRWNDAEIYTAIARTLNLTADQRKTILAARQYLHDKLAKCALLRIPAAR